MSLEKNDTNSANGKTSAEVSGLSTECQENEFLKAKIVQLRKQIEQEQYKCTHFQKERDKMHTFWKITKRQVEEKKAEIKNKDREIKEAIEKHQNEIKMYMYQVKHLLYPPKGKTADLKEVDKKDMAMMPPPTESLLKYSNPILVSNKNTKNESPSPQKPATFSSIPSPAKPKRPSSEAILQQTEKILDTILPPREWVKNNQLWVQQVSSVPCSQMDVIRLQEELELRLRQRQAKDLGICPVRRELYSQCFDELIRQVTINCAERGLLLSQLRDEICMTLTAYQTQYESSVAYGMKKTLEAKQWKFEIEKKIADLENKKIQLESQLAEEKAKYEATLAQGIDRQQAEEIKRAEEIQLLKDTSEKLEDQLTLLIAPKK